MRSKKLGSLHNALIALALFAFPSTALAFDWGLKLEPGMAAAAAEPQSRLFGPGFGGSTLDANVKFKGTVLAQTSNSVEVGCTVDGRLLCSNGAITLKSDTINLP
jgi:hypothetical protein